MPPDYQEAAPRRISFVRLGIVILVLVGLGALVWAIFFRASPTNQATNPPAASSSQSNQTQHQTTPNQNQHTSSTGSSNGTSSTSSGSNSSSNSSSSSTSSTPPSSTSQSSASSSGQSSHLTNTGPGDTVALFIGATVLGAGIRYVAIRRSIQSKGYR